MANLRERLRKVEQAKEKMDEPRIVRLIYRESEPIPPEAYQCASPVLIWDLDEDE